jgi:hypothetical protein
MAEKKAEKKDAKVETFEGPVSEAPVEAPQGAEASAPDAGEPREPQAVVNQGEVPAQVRAERKPDSDVVKVSETHVTLDEVITDPSSPLAVQVPEAAEDEGALPIHALAKPRPEDVFSDEASKSDKK